MLLVKHTEFTKLDPAEIAKKSRARVIVDTVNGWNGSEWTSNAFKFYRLGDNKSKFQA